MQLDEWQLRILSTTGNICLCSGRQVGKSTIVARKAGEFAATHQKKSVLIISATERQAEELFIKTLAYIKDSYSNLIKSGRDKPTKHILKLKNGSIIRCLPVGSGGVGVRGFTTDMLIADEAAFIPDDVWLAVTPQLLTTGGDIILLSTPHGRQGYFYECFQSEDFTKFHVNSEEVIRNRTIGEGWSEIQKIKALEHLEREKKKMSANEYAQEYMGEFIAEFSIFFRDELIRKSCVKKRSGNIVNGNTYFLGVDVARMGDDDVSFQIIDRTDRKKIIHVDSIKMKKVYLNEIYDRILELDSKYKFKKIFIDDGGIGVGVFDFLKVHEQTKGRIEAINNNKRVLDRDEKHKKKLLKEDLYNNLLGLMERGEIWLLDDDEVIESLKSCQYEYLTKLNSPTLLRIFSNPHSKSHIVEGLIRAAWAHQDKTLNIWVR
jgi:hypothetical protein